MNQDAYRRWILANGLSESVGLGATFMLAYLISSRIDLEAGRGLIVAGAFAAIFMGTLLEGLVVGAAQAWALTPLPSRPTPRHWIVATAIGAGVAWSLGMIPSTVMALLAEAEPGAAPWEPPPLLQYGLAAMLGAMLGPVLGLAQWAVLRNHAPNALRWLWANSLAWAIGMPVIFLGMEFLPWEDHRVGAYAGVFVVCLIAGLVVGAIHGRWITRMLGESVEPLLDAG